MYNEENFSIEELAESVAEYGIKNLSPQLEIKHLAEILENPESKEKFVAHFAKIARKMWDEVSGWI